MQLDIHISWFDCEICFYTGESCRNVLQVRNLELQNTLGSKTRDIEHYEKNPLGVRKQMPKVSKYQVLGPYHERSLQGQAKQFYPYNFCLNCDVTRLWLSLISWWLGLSGHAH